MVQVNLSAKQKQRHRSRERMVTKWDKGGVGWIGRLGLAYMHS